MFTGIIEEKGKVLRTEPDKLHIRAQKVLEGTKVGDSIAVNGVCLTVTALDGSLFTADVMPETMQRSSLGTLRSGSGVNLERAMAADGRFGGHIVSGHIDGTGTVENIVKDGNAVRCRIRTQQEITRGIVEKGSVTIDTKPEILRLIVEKGSVAIDGISLTVTMVQSERFEVSVIPHTLKETILGEKRIGSVVNLENDIIGKYVERLLFSTQKETQGMAQKETVLTREFLLRAGF